MEEATDSVIDVPDPRFPARTYPTGWHLNDFTPWQTKVIPFEHRTYTQAEQDRITQDERRIFNATEMMVPANSGMEKQLNIALPPPQGSLTPVMDVALPQDLSNPPEMLGDQSEHVQSPAVRNEHRFGNNLFGSRFQYWSFVGANPRNRDIVNSSRLYVETTVFNFRREVARVHFQSAINCTVPNGPPGYPTEARAWIYIMGQLAAAPLWRQSFNTVGRLPVFRVDRDHFAARKTFMVGPVPITVRAVVRGDVGLDLGGTLDCQHLSLSARPYANLFIRTDVSINVIVLQVGFSGTLNLIGVSLPSESHIRWANSDLCPTWRANVDRNINTLSGSIGLFAIVRFLFFRQRYDLTIANWSGVNWTNSVFNQGGTLPVSSSCPSAQAVGAP